MPDSKLLPWVVGWFFLVLCPLILINFLFYDSNLANYLSAYASFPAAALALFIAVWLEHRKDVAAKQEAISRARVAAVSLESLIIEVGQEAMIWKVRMKPMGENDSIQRDVVLEWAEAYPQHRSNSLMSRSSSFHLFDEVLFNQLVSLLDKQQFIGRLAEQVLIYEKIAKHNSQKEPFPSDIIYRQVNMFADDVYEIQHALRQSIRGSTPAKVQAG